MINVFRGGIVPIDDVHVLITFYSRGGLTERIAVWLAEGAVQAGAKIRLRRARDIAPEETILLNPEWAANRDRMHEEFAAPTEADAAWAHVLAFGMPASTEATQSTELTVAMSEELAAYLERFRTGDLQGKIGTGFTSSYLPNAQNKSAQAALQAAMDRAGLTLFTLEPQKSDATATDWDLAHAQGHQVVAAARAIHLKQLRGVSS
jgi:NAD(P)H dehydrogenase (quinone)